MGRPIYPIPDTPEWRAAQQASAGERLARELCRRDGWKPDALFTTQPMWRNYEAQARVILSRK